MRCNRLSVRGERRQPSPRALLYWTYGLNRLRSARLVDCVRPYVDSGSVPLHWWLTPRGVSVVTGQPIERRTGGCRPKPMFMAHTTAIAEVWIALRSAAPSLGFSLVVCNPEAAVTERVWRQSRDDDDLDLLALLRPHVEAQRFAIIQAQHEAEEADYHAPITAFQTMKGVGDALARKLEEPDQHLGRAVAIKFAQIRNGGGWTEWAMDRREFGR